ncbi:hypothetical protein [Streptomyces sp. CB03234]|uniref:hypothetical protein n=1 Tax=Streptomyces sp. (strain CB03234) TaxID=1703937 RepID=UPI001A7E054E|nr:hypothetical protein [Streptomyces sp. CB03234]
MRNGMFIVFGEAEHGAACAGPAGVDADVFDAVPGLCCGPQGAQQDPLGHDVSLRRGLCEDELDQVQVSTIALAGWRVRAGRCGVSVP